MDKSTSKPIKKTPIIIPSKKAELDTKKQEYKALKSNSKPKTIAELVARLEKLEEILGL